MEDASIYMDLMLTKYLVRHSERVANLIFELQANVLVRHLESHDAETVPELNQLSQRSASAGEDSAFLLVPHTSSETDIPSTRDSLPRPTIVTDMWIELCLHRKRYVQPNAHITSSPFRYPSAGELRFSANKYIS